MKYETCPKCGITYNISRERDDSKVFVCQDCESRERAKIRGKKARTIYDKLGYARVVHYLLPVLILPFLFGFAKTDADLYPVPLDAELQEHIINISEVYHVDAALVMAIIERESRFDENAIGDNGNSYGLMQINAQYHRERMAKLGVSNLRCAYCNVLVGIDYFAELLEEYGDAHKALVAYNAGRMGAYNGWFSVGRYQSDYSRAVVARAEEIGGFEIE